jgi:hypothetical protein
MNFPNFETFNLQDLAILLNKSNCNCHFINPHKTRILMWKQVKDGKTTYFLKIGIQKFTSQEQIDRNGEVYWRYWSFEVQEPTQELNSISQEKAPEYAKSNSTNHSESS